MFLGCASGQSEVNRSGALPADPFTEEVKFELYRNLIVVPVEIEGETYRFIWDTGAASAISTRLQEKMRYRTIKRTTISDSQNNRAKTRFVRVSELKLGDVSFSKQAAIILDFEKHPVLACMNLDGIIGRNTHRLCNWILDYQAGMMTITNEPVEKPEGGFEASFSYDDDYDIKLNLGLASASVTKIKFDTGFTGGVSLPGKLFRKWTDLVEPDSLYVERGYQQSGLMAVPERVDSYTAFADSLTLGSFVALDVEVNNGASGLVGNEVWSQFVLTLDWQDKKLYGLPAQGYSVNRKVWGFAVSWDAKTDQAYILRVLEGSQADLMGLEPLMVVEQIGSVNFMEGATYCDYLAAQQMKSRASESLEVTVRGAQDQRLSFSIDKTEIK